MRIDAVLLDMGGVLIPEIPDYSGAARDPLFRNRLGRLGVLDPGRLVRDAGTRLKEAYRALEESCEQPDPDIVLRDLKPAVRRLLLLAFGEQVAQRPYPHARDVVARLARRFRLGLVSNTVVPGEPHGRKLALYGILEHLGCAVWSAEFGRRKPHPSIVLAALKKLGVPPERAAFVGDKIRTDVRAAHAARVRSIWLRGAWYLPTEGPRPDFVIRDLRELPLLLERLTPPGGSGPG